MAAPTRGCWPARPRRVHFFRINVTFMLTRYSAILPFLTATVFS